MKKRLIITTTISAIVAAIIFELIIYSFNKVFNFIEAAIFFVIYWLAFFFIQRYFLKDKFK